MIEYKMCWYSVVQMNNVQCKWIMNIIITLNHNWEVSLIKIITDDHMYSVDDGDT